MKFAMCSKSWICTSFTIVAALRLLLADSTCHHRQKRFVFFPGSVLQLAAGLAIPADVPDKIIYTNYGIMINYDLPTNLSSLLPITLLEEAKSLTPSGSLSHLTADLLMNFGLNKGCLNDLRNYFGITGASNGHVDDELASIISRDMERDELLNWASPDDYSLEGNFCPIKRQQ